MILIINHLLNCLLFYVVQKLVRIWIRCACKHKILPHHDAETVANIEEIIRRIDAAAPHTKHIEMSRHTFRQQFDSLFSRHPCLDHLLWNVIRTFYINFLSVHLKIHSASDAVRFFYKLNLTNSCHNFFSINEFGILINLDFKIRHVLFTHLVRPPKIGIFQLKRYLHKVFSFRKDNLLCKFSAIMLHHEFQLMFAITGNLDVC